MMPGWVGWESAQADMMADWVEGGRTGGRLESQRLSMVATTLTSWRSSQSKRSMSCSTFPNHISMLLCVQVWCGIAYLGQSVPCSA